MTSAELIKRLRAESDERAMKSGATVGTVERYRAPFYETMMDDLIDTLLAIADAPASSQWAQEMAQQAIRQITFPPDEPAGDVAAPPGGPSPVASLS